jgi:hypothetical protein
VVVAIVAIGAMMVTAVPASAAPGLPRTYQVLRVDSPVPVTGGTFGIGFVNAGDLNDDGVDDLLVGTDEHGLGIGGVYEISGKDGSLIRTLTDPNPQPSPAPNPAFGSYVGKLGDIGSCPGAHPGEICPNPTIGPPDGVPDLLVSALNANVTDNEGNTVTAGRVYVIDGATGAILKILQMPDQDLKDQITAGANPAFGRTVLTPAGMAPCAGNMGVGPCTSMPTAVKVGDVTGGTVPSILVGASDYFETGGNALSGGTSNPASPCYAAAAGTPCQQAGREYVYSGEAIAGTDPSAIDNTPIYTIKNPTAQPDDTTTPVNSNRENMGYSIAPVGDLGSCVADSAFTPTPGSICPTHNSSPTPPGLGGPDGVPDFALSSHRTDDFGMFDVGVVYLIDGKTGAVLYTYHSPEPQPAELFGFSNYNQPAIGDVGSSAAPDIYEAAMRENVDGFTGAGKGFVLDGQFTQAGSPNTVSFASFQAPNPQASMDFGTSSAGVGNIADVESGLDNRNEILIGAYGPHNPGTNPYLMSSVGFYSPLTEKALQTIADPDAQPGSGFGQALAPLGDINGDGFLDFAVGSGYYTGTTGSRQGRIYIFRSDNSPLPTPPSSPPSSPPSTGGGTTTVTTAATVLAGRTLEIQLGANKIARNHKFRLIGLLEAFSNQTVCEARQPVKIQRRAPGNLRYTTLKTVTTDSRGNFSTRLNATSTSIYRAWVDQTSQCLGAVSQTKQLTVTRTTPARKGPRLPLVDSRMHALG